jgi:hypothetical protein
LKALEEINCEKIRTTVLESEIIRGGRKEGPNVRDLQFYSQLKFGSFCNLEGGFWFRGSMIEPTPSPGFFTGKKPRLFKRRVPKKERKKE